MLDTIVFREVDFCGRLMAVFHLRVYFGIFTTAVIRRFFFHGFAEFTSCSLTELHRSQLTPAKMQAERNADYTDQVKGT